MNFIQLLIVEGVLLLSAGMIYFAGIWGTVGATFTLSAMNFLFHDAQIFWHWEIPLLFGGMIGILLLFMVGKIANNSRIVSGLVGGFISLVFFGAFVTPIAAIVFLALVVGTGLIPTNKKSQVFWSLTPMILRLMLGFCWIIYGNIITL